MIRLLSHLSSPPPPYSTGDGDGGGGSGGGGGEDGGPSGAAMAALAVLAVDAGLIGAALGSLLPRPASGASLGLASVLLAEASARAFLGGGGRRRHNVVRDRWSGGRARRPLEG